MMPFLGARGAQPDPARARIAVLPVPYDGSVCWHRGTARGPEMLLRASAHVELYDEQIDAEPWRHGVWTAEPLSVRDEAPREVARQVEVRVGELMDAGMWVVMLGGEHSITPGAVRAAASRHPGLVVVQIDAHADLRDDYAGDAFTHASAMTHCLATAPVRAVGVRSYTADEARKIRDGIPGYRLVHAWEAEGEAWHDRILEGLEGAPVWLTFDVDGLDPSIMPATGTPEPGGLDWYPTLRFLDRLFALARVVGCDVVELSPRDGLHHADFTAARLAYKLMGYALRG